MRLLIYPDTFETKKVYSKIQRYISISKVEVTYSPVDSFDVVMYWSYHRTIRQKDAALEEISKYYNVINEGCNDITKSRNEAMMKLSFGYNALITANHKEKMLMKSESQGIQDVKIVKGPCKSQKGYIYCKLLDNRIGNKYRDYRLFTFDGQIIMTIIVDKSAEHRFSAAPKADLQIGEGLITDKEKQNIKKYCLLHGTHVAELDTIRDNGKLYITDNNNVPAYSKKMKNILEGKNINKLAEAFYKTLKRHAQ